jgi:hypothetical protein
MASITKRQIPFVLSYYRYIKHQQRYAVTITDEYRASTKSRSSIKGVDLLRNPALNKVKEKRF